MYKIQYNYNTGDSSHKERNLVSTLELTWENKDVARDNLRRIKEHYINYQKFNNSGPFYSWGEHRKKLRIEAEKAYKDSDWSVIEKGRIVDPCIILKSDN